MRIGKQRMSVRNKVSENYNEQLIKNKYKTNREMYKASTWGGI